MFHKKLQKLVKQYFDKHPNIRLVVVVGSVGKASVKRAIGTVLSTKYRVRMHDEVDPSPFSIPFTILGIAMPKKMGLFAGLKALSAARRVVKKEAVVDVIVQELPMNAKGSVAQYVEYLHPAITVITAISPVRLQLFPSVDALAQEIMSITAHAGLAIINRDDVEGRFAELITTPNITTYGSDVIAEYSVVMTDSQQAFDTKIQIGAPEWQAPIETTTALVGEHSIRALAASTAVASQLGMTEQEIATAIPQVQAMPGRMNPLRGIQGTVILDDSKSSSPADAASALQTLYSFSDAPQRIAILGDMDHLHERSAEYHGHIGALCNPDFLAWVVVVGEQSSGNLATVAKQRGCQVKVCRDAIEAGAFVRSITEDGAIILVKGSRISHLEETVKILCNMSEDHQLVRQSPEDMRMKDDLFSRFSDAK